MTSILKDLFEKLPQKAKIAVVIVLIILCVALLIIPRLVYNARSTALVRECEQRTREASEYYEWIADYKGLG